MTIARGSFEVTVTPADADGAIGRMLIAKTWSGDLTATGHGQMLSAGDPAESALTRGHFSRQAAAPPTVAFTWWRMPAVEYRR